MRLLLTRIGAVLPLAHGRSFGDQPSPFDAHNFDPAAPSPPGFWPTPGDKENTADGLNGQLVPFPDRTSSSDRPKEPQVVRRFQLEPLGQSAKAMVHPLPQYFRLTQTQMLNRQTAEKTGLSAATAALLHTKASMLKAALLCPCECLNSQFATELCGRSKEEVAALTHKWVSEASAIEARVQQTAQEVSSVHERHHLLDKKPDPCALATRFEDAITGETGFEIALMRTSPVAGASNKLWKASLNEQVYQKQQRQYQGNPTQFLPRLLAMLLRHAPCMEGSPSQKLHSQLPRALFRVLRRRFDVSTECFASPLNNFGDDGGALATPMGYCSLFPNIDRYFGSSGSFFDFHPDEGSHEVNPPFVGAVAAAALRHIGGLLSRSAKPLSFVVFLPENMWRTDHGCVRKAREQVIAEGWLTKEVDTKGAAGYGRGDSCFHPPSHERQFVPSSDTNILFLQNDAGQKKWPVTEEAVDEMLKAFRAAPCNSLGTSASASADAGGAASARCARRWLEEEAATAAGREREEEQQEQQPLTTPTARAPRANATASSGSGGGGGSGRKRAAEGMSICFDRRGERPRVAMTVSPTNRAATGRSTSSSNSSSSTSSSGGGGRWSWSRSWSNSSRRSSNWGGGGMPYSKRRRTAMRTTTGYYA